MSDFETITRQLKSKPILLVDSDAGECRLITREQMTRRMMDATDAFEAGILMDLERGASNFAKLAGREDREFVMTDLQAITAMPYATLDGWIARGVLTPSIREGDGGGRNKERLFSWRDAFAAGALAALRRQCVAIPMLKRVSRLLTSTRDAVEVA